MDIVISPKKRGRCLDIGLYPNDLSHYKVYLQELRQTFRVRKEFAESASQELVKVKADYERKYTTADDLLFVGVHVRRTDYQAHLSKLYNLTLISEQYLLHAMDFYKRKFQVRKIAFIQNTTRGCWHSRARLSA